VTDLLEEWCAQWKSEQELRPLIIGHENNGRFLQTSPKDAIILSLTLEASFGDCSEQIQIGVPYYTIEPLVKKMQAKRQKDTAVSPAVKSAEWQKAYDRIQVPVRAEWQALDLTGAGDCQPARRRRARDAGVHLQRDPRAAQRHLQIHRHGRPRFRPHRHPAHTPCAGGGDHPCQT
jgi:hypothetical protein